MALVSIIVPCFNEEGTIVQLLSAIAAQTYGVANLEVVLADGMSTDATRARIAQFQTNRPELKLTVVGNPSRLIPAGLNLAINTAKGEYFVRLDAHSVPQPDYVERSIADLQANKGWNVGGVWEIQPGADTWMAKSIAIAAAHPLGVGDALYRYAKEAAEVDTVPFGAFHRSLIDKIGKFDESLEANEDYEFNTRIRQAGGKVWLNPAIRSAYFARPTLGALARQYWRYGFWKVRMLRRYPATLRWRQVIPPLFVLSLLLLSAASFLLIPRMLLIFEMVSYALLLVSVSVQKAIQHRQLSLMAGIPLAMMTMHVSWGAAFLWSLSHREGKQKPKTNG